jgi:hypothetical protein
MIDDCGPTILLKTHKGEGGERCFLVWFFWEPRKTDTIFCPFRKMRASLLGCFWKQDGRSKTGVGDESQSHCFGFDCCIGQTIVGISLFIHRHPRHTPVEQTIPVEQIIRTRNHSQTHALHSDTTQIEKQPTTTVKETVTVTVTMFRFDTQKQRLIKTNLFSSSNIMVCGIKFACYIYTPVQD